MANVTMNTKFQLRNDIKANWISENPILLKGEIGIEIDTRKFKIGDGVKTWTALEYASSLPAILSTSNPETTDSGHDIGSLWVNTSSDKAFLLYDNAAGNAIWKQIVNPNDLADLGAGDMLKAEYATNPKSNQGYVDKAVAADKLTTPASIALSGDVNASGVNFDGSSGITIATVLKDIVTAGSGAKVTINAKGLVTEIAPLAPSDIPNLTLSKITDAGTAASKNVGNAVGEVVVVNAQGEIDASLMPSIAITDIFEVANQTAMLALTAQQGDVAIRSDLNRSFILKQEPASTLANWIELKTPTDVVLSVNGETGAVTLTTTHIAEGSNMYYTEARATSNFNTNFSSKSSANLSDGNTILHTSDTLILNGGTSGGW